MTAALHVDLHLVFHRLFSPDSAFLGAMVKTIYIAVIAQAVGTVIGIVVALAAMSKSRLLRWMSGGYVLVFRGTPVIVQIFFVYFGANLFLGFDLFPRTANILGASVDGAVIAGIVALSINEGAYMREIIRAGILAIDSGQMEAAQSVGMTWGLGMRRIVLPQAARVIVPPLGNQFNSMLKTTSLLAFIGVYEMFQDAQVHYSSSFQPVEYFFAVGVWYLALTTAWSLLQARIERRLDYDRIDVRGTAHGRVASGLELEPR
jgi:polar amino acid transport system permease protein